VSANKIGVRCRGSCNYWEPAGDIDQLEMHFRNNPLYHWSEFHIPCPPSPSPL
jgi:hypothetical protein